MNVKIIPALLSLSMFLIFACPLPMGILNAGNGAGMLITAVLTAVFVFWKQFRHLISSMWEKTAGKIFLCSASAVLVICTVLAVVLSVSMLRQINDPPPNDDTTLIVLGCKVKDGRPSLMLKRRLDAAYGYLSEHESVSVVVSGGKGNDELISEAECMKQYLTSKGISADRIFMEDKSTTTKENLIFSRNIIEANGLSQTVTLVTDGYHQKRAEMLAENLDIHPYNISGYTSWYIIPTYWVREWFGLLYYGIFG